MSGCAQTQKQAGFECVFGPLLLDCEGNAPRYLTPYRPSVLDQRVDSLRMFGLAAVQLLHLTYPLHGWMCGGRRGPFISGLASYPSVLLSQSPP